MTNARTARHAGFTMIEVIIATAIAVVLLAAIHSTVAAMFRSATAIRKHSDEQAHLQRFLEILRRDLQGWYEVSAASQGQESQGSAAEGLKPFLRFSTTADCLSGTNRCVQVEYALGNAPSGISIFRRETGPNARSLEVFSGAKALKIEFLGPQGWLPEWSQKARPEALRIMYRNHEMILSL